MRDAKYCGKRHWIISILSPVNDSYKLSPSLKLLSSAISGIKEQELSLVVLLRMLPAPLGFTYLTLSGASPMNLSSPSIFVVLHLLFWKNKIVVLSKFAEWWSRYYNPILEHFHRPQKFPAHSVFPFICMGLVYYLLLHHPFLCYLPHLYFGEEGAGKD